MHNMEIKLPSVCDVTLLQDLRLPFFDSRDPSSSSDSWTRRRTSHGARLSTAIPFAGHQIRLLTLWPCHRVNPADLWHKFGESVSLFLPLHDPVCFDEQVLFISRSCRYSASILPLSHTPRSYWRLPFDVLAMFTSAAGLTHAILRKIMDTLCYTFDTVSLISTSKRRRSSCLGNTSLHFSYSLRIITHLACHKRSAQWNGASVIRNISNKACN